MEKLGKNERHDDKINREDPNWTLIYSYLTALLKADELPELGQIGLWCKVHTGCIVLVCCIKDNTDTSA